MRWKSERLWVASLAVVIGLAGCSDWESSGDGSAWDDSLNWLDFSGVYVDISAGVLVRDGSAGVTAQTSINEVIATGDGASTSFSGSFANGGVVPGSVLISAGQFGFVDDGAGALNSPAGYAASITETFVASGSSVNSGVVSSAPILPGSASISAGNVTVVDNAFGGTGEDDDGILQDQASPAPNNGSFVYATGAWSLDTFGALPAGTTISVTYQVASTGTGVSGAIAYESGGWTINLQGTPVPAGTTITATYRYAQALSPAATSASSGTPIYTFNVLQTGDRLRIIDSNGNEYEGQLFDVNSSAGDLTVIPPSGDDDNPQVADFIASFYAEGSANGVFVTLDGSFAGSILEDERQNTLFDRRMSGSWRESGGNAGVYFGVTVPISTSGSGLSTTNSI